MLISVCIPCYRSAKTIPVVVEAIKAEFANRPEDYQIVLVNDDSPDATLGAIIELCKSDPKIVGVNMSRNYGQASAKLAALTQAKGDIIVFMDDDGQHPADGIFKLVDKLNEGYDIVYAHFKNKQHGKSTQFTSNLHNWLSEVMGTKPKGIKRSSFTAWSRTVVDATLKYKSPFVSIGAFVMSVTTKFANVEIEHHKRMEGTSGYTFKKRLKMWMNIFISFSMLPLRVVSYMGIAFAGVGFLWSIYLFIRKLLNPGMVAGYASSMIMELLTSGVILISLGIMGEYLGRIYMTVSGMPQYNVREVINGEKSDE